MLYSEFIEGTRCKDNAHNYEVYKNLEAMYMNSDMTKEKVYEYGRQLVNNEKTAEELKIAAELKADIESYKVSIENYKKDIEWKKTCIAMDPYDKNWVKDCKNGIKYYKDQIKYCRSRIRELKWILG